MFRRLLLLFIVLLLSSTALAQEPIPTPLSTKLARIVKAAVTGELPTDYAEQQAIDDQSAGVVRLTDDNFVDKVQGGDRDDVWVVMIHDNTPAGGNKPFFDAHTNATKIFGNRTVIEDGEGVNGRRVIFARMLYDSEWKTCTRWLVFKPPRLVFVTENGASVRFLAPHQIKPDGERWAKWIEDGKWILMEQWSSQFGPNGSRAWVIEAYIRFFETLSPHLAKIPSVAWLFLTGIVGKLFMDWFHPPAYPPEAYETNPDPQVGRRRPAQRSTSETPAPTMSSAISTTTTADPSGGGKDRDTR